MVQNETKGPRRSGNSKWDEELAVAKEAAARARVIMMKHYGQLEAVREKLHEGLVTEADQECERTIRHVIGSAFPQDAVIGEEQGWQAGQARSEGDTSLERTWLVDPIDGTTNYVYGLPFFCVSIGLQVQGEMRVGVVEAPELNWNFHAVQGEGAFRNQKAISCSLRPSLREGLFATGFAYHYSGGDQHLEQQLAVLRYMVTHARGVRRAGSAALDLCMVACGILDGYWEKPIKSWDTAAGSLIAAEAGAKVTNFAGESYLPQMADVLACNPKVQPEVLQVLSKIGD